MTIIARESLEKGINWIVKDEGIASPDLCFKMGFDEEEFERLLERTRAYIEETTFDSEIHFIPLNKLYSNNPRGYKISRYAGWILLNLAEEKSEVRVMKAVYPFNGKKMEHRLGAAHYTGERVQMLIQKESKSGLDLIVDAQTGLPIGVTAKAYSKFCNLKYNTILKRIQKLTNGKKHPIIDGVVWNDDNSEDDESIDIKTIQGLSAKANTTTNKRKNDNLDENEKPISSDDSIYYMTKNNDQVGFEISTEHEVESSLTYDITTLKTVECFLNTTQNQSKNEDLSVFDLVHDKEMTLPERIHLLANLRTVFVTEVKVKKAMREVKVIPIALMCEWLMDDNLEMAKEMMKIGMMIYLAQQAGFNLALEAPMTSDAELNQILKDGGYNLQIMNDYVEMPSLLDKTQPSRRKDDYFLF